ncbi:MAG TPA: TetR/AcrR family transcriptional regulator [Pseudonocardiaceae bacterium]|nr:TetR/AcrR family transcriptional regulator [Pseudonocardiaceae bacterium]
MVNPANPAIGARQPTADRIVRAAVELFAERGFDATSVQQIVERAAVTKGALYHYFTSKDDLLFAIYQSLIGVQNADLEDIVARGMAPAETVRAILVGVIVSTAERGAEAAVFFRESPKLDAQHMAAFRADRRRYHENFRQVVEKAQTDGVFSARVPADVVVQIAMGVVNQLPIWFRPDGPKTAERLGHEVADFVLAALLPEEPRP